MCWPHAPSTNQPPSEEMRALRMLRPSSVKHCTTCRLHGRQSAGICCAKRSCAAAAHLNQCARPVCAVNYDHCALIIGLIVYHHIGPAGSRQGRRHERPAMSRGMQHGASETTHMLSSALTGAGAAPASQTPARCHRWLLMPVRPLPQFCGTP